MCVCVHAFSRAVHIYASGLDNTVQACQYSRVYVCVSVCLFPSVYTVWSLLGAKGQTVCHGEVSGYDELGEMEVVMAVVEMPCH